MPERCKVLVNGTKRKVKTWQIDDLVTNIWTSDGEIVETNLSNAPWYKTLLALDEAGLADKRLIVDGDWIHDQEHNKPLKIFVDYCIFATKRWMEEPMSEEHMQSIATERDDWAGDPPWHWPWDILSYKGFIELYEDIRDNGYDNGYHGPTLTPQVGKESFIVSDGQHRMSILKYLGYEKICRHSEYIELV